jgi:flagellar protein FliL
VPFQRVVSNILPVATTATPTPTQPADAAAAPPAPAKKKLPLPLMLAVGLVLGLGGGWFIVGHFFGSKPAAAGDEAAAAASGEKGGEAGAAIYAVDNLILNPAESGGTRFLMVSISVEMKSQAAVTSLRDRDAQVRDVLLHVLGAKTVEQLADITQRDEIKQEVLVAITKLAPKGSVTALYFPHFVIQ